MTDPAPSSPPEKRHRSWRGCILTGVALAVLGMVLPGLFLSDEWSYFLIERAWMGLRIATIFVIGPVTFLIRVVPAVSFNLQLAACGLTAFGLAIWLIHRLAASVGRPWPLGRSVRLALLVPAMFGAAVAAVGIVHQTGWLFRSGVVMSSWADYLLSSQAHALASCHAVFVAKHGRSPESMEELASEFDAGWLPRFRSEGWRYVPNPPADGDPILFVAPSRFGGGKMVVCRTGAEMPRLMPPVTPEADVIAELRAQKRLR